MSLASLKRRIEHRGPFARVRDSLVAAGRRFFGDRLGVVVFLSCVLFTAMYWRVGIFLNDSYAIGNTLVNVADGHLEIRRLQYSLTFGSQPGLWVAEGAVYGRNYAHVFLSLPVLWVLDASSVLFDPRLTIAAAWSLVLFATIEQTGQILDRHRQCLLGGAGVAVLTFLANVATATPLDSKWFPFIALQTTTMLAAAALAVVLYRLLTHVHDRRLGFLIGLGTIVATPVGFWASIPKRHVLSAFAATVVLAGFYFARTAESRRTALTARAIPYATIALWTWLHPLEALVVFAAFVPFDLLCAESNHPRKLAVIGVVFALAMTPFLATNYAISGNPMQPPRTLDPYFGQVDPTPPGTNGTDPTPTEGAANTSTSLSTGRDEVNARSTAVSQNTSLADGSASGTPPDSGTPTNSSGPTSSDGVLGLVIGIVTSLAQTAVDRGLWTIQRAKGFFDNGIATLLSEPERLYYTFVRSGRIPLERMSYEVNQQEAIELTVLETAPLLGALVGLLAVGGRKLRTLGEQSFASTRDWGRAGLARPERQTDLLALSIAVPFTLVNLDRLPWFTQITVRHLVPLLPLGLYGVGRCPSVRRATTVDVRWLAGLYLGLVVCGGVGITVVAKQLGVALGEAMQFHALLGLGSAVALVVWAVLSGAGVDIDRRIGAFVVLLPAALTTLFLLFTGFVYLQYADYALPIARTLAELVSINL